MLTPLQALKSFFVVVVCVCGTLDLHMALMTHHCLIQLADALQMGEQKQTKIGKGKEGSCLSTTP
jgi:hypothetical protein